MAIRFDFSTFLMVFGSFFALWLLGMLLADLDGFRTVAQMQSRGPEYQKGIPWDHHVAMKYLDALPFPALMAMLAALYGYQWTRGEVIVLGIIGVAFSGLMHFTYIEAGKHFPEFVTYFGKLPPV